ncbi:MAG TPA: HypC/HybG/HupF family hydrogenase formation chaperone [Clostridia bacterium]|nr:HypC/HybG/HupF family hydrogenase formation chaperone [Clostridia bacterium]
MCLAVPGKIIEIISEAVARVDYGSLVTNVDLSLVPEAKPGQWVLVHAGFAVQVLDEAEARETLALLRELDAHV